MEKEPRHSKHLKRKTEPIMKTTLKSDENITAYSNYKHIRDDDGNSSTVLGQGTCSIIYLVKNKLTNQKYAQKAFNFATFPKLKHNIEKEIFYYERFIHENIIKVYSQNSRGDNINIILDYARKGTLSSVITNNGHFDEATSFFYFYQILNGLNYIHSHNFILRNLKPENILIANNNRALISDLSMCQKIKPNKICFYDSSEDIWSLGLILYIMTQGIKNKAYDNDFQSCSFEVPISENCQQLIKMLFDTETKSLKAIYDHPWIKSYLIDPKKIVVSKLKDSTIQKKGQVLSENNEYLSNDYQTCTKETSENYMFDPPNVEVSAINRLSNDLRKNDYCFNERQYDTGKNMNKNREDIEQLINTNHGYVKNIRESAKEQKNSDIQFVDSIAVLNKAQKTKAKDVVLPVIKKESEDIWDKVSCFFIGKCK